MDTLNRPKSVPACFRGSLSLPLDQGDHTNRPIVGATERFRKEASDRIARLTDRQTEVLDLVVAGYASKSISHALQISQRTVENHRAEIAERIGANSIPDLVRVAICGRCDLYNAPALIDDMKEVQHRFKNMVAVIQSISHQTMRQCTSIEDFDERFSARLSAFCRSLDELIANDWRGVAISSLVQTQLEPFGSRYTNQISVGGPDLDLTPAASHNIGLALHELATNALKYGCLSVPNGRVEVRWVLATIEGEDRFRMSWSEFGGPYVTTPTRRGFGRELIENLTASALAGTALYEFLPTGVKWSLDVPRINCCSPMDTHLPDGEVSTKG
jgi:two-component sensor histidine kinase/DNA-binding CsgD family transcriptional regulator